MEELYEKMVEFCKERIGSDPVSGPDHAQRVLRWCEIISELESQSGRSPDLEVLRAAAILHDLGVPLGRHIHHSAGAEIAQEFLNSINFPPEKIEAVTEAIKSHSRYGGPEPATLEGFILRDADMLDFTGAVGISRAILREFQKMKYNGDPVMVPAMIKNLIARVNGKFHTELGKKIAQTHFKFMNEFVERLRDELSPVSMVD